VYLDQLGQAYGVPSAKSLLDGLRYMVQEYVMNGLTVSLPSSKWFYGYQSNIFNFVSQGDFYQGNDKDLDNNINTVFNTATNKVVDSIIKVNSGSSDPY